MGIWRDLLFFVGTPVVILPVIFLALRSSAPSQLYLYVAAFGALGHHLPGMMRAYGDRALFRRFKVRFVVAPVFLVSVCVYFAFTQPKATILLAYLWGVWHGAMQTHGFLRIYDAKYKSFARVTAVLDQTLCLSWFAAGVLLSPTRVIYILENLYRAGAPAVPVEWIQWSRYGVIGVVSVVTAAYVWNAVRLWRAGHPPSPVKLLLVGTSIAFWLYANVAVENLLVGIVLFELFHDTQYLAIVWMFNRRRAETDPAVGTFTRYVFGRGQVMVVLYLGLIFAYGSLHLIRTALPPDFASRFLGAVLSASAFLHFYYDGFIWKVRERSTRTSLGIEGGKDAVVSRRSFPSWASHGLKWSVFAVPVLLLAWGWHRGGMTPSEITHELVRVSPDVAEIQYNYGIALREEGDPEGSIAAERRALELNRLDPVLERRATANLAWALVDSGQRLLQEGRDDEALARFEEAHGYQSALPEILARHGLEEEKRGEYRRALLHYRAAALMNPGYGFVHVRAAVTAGMQGEWLEALGYAQKAQEVLPQDPDVANLVSRIETELGRGSMAAGH